MIAFTNDDGDRLIAAINPKGASQVVLYQNDTVIEDGLKNKDFKVTSVNCEADLQMSEWECAFTLDRDLLPPNLNRYQIVHDHYTVDERHERMTAICPGFTETQPEEWRGCETDFRFFTSANANADYSNLWQKAMGNGAKELSVANLLLVAFISLFWISQ